MEDRQPSAGYKYFPGSEDSTKVVQIVEHDKWVPSYSWQGGINYQNALGSLCCGIRGRIEGRRVRVCVLLGSLDIVIYSHLCFPFFPPVYGIHIVHIIFTSHCSELPSLRQIRGCEERALFAFLSLV